MGGKKQSKLDSLKIVDQERKTKIKEAATYIPNPDRISIIGDGRLDFWVRNGARYNPPSRPTSKKGKDIMVKCV